jgi:hypothetical protein
LLPLIGVEEERSEPMRASTGSKSRGVAACVGFWGCVLSCSVSVPAPLGAGASGVSSLQYRLPASEVPFALAMNIA